MCYLLSINRTKYFDSNWLTAITIYRYQQFEDDRNQVHHGSWYFYLSIESASPESYHSQTAGQDFIKDGISYLTYYESRLL